MALSATPPLARFASQMVKQTALSTTADNHIIGAAAEVACIDLTHNGGASTTGFLKVWNDTNPTEASTVCDLCFPVTNGQRQVLVISPDVAFSSGISWAFGDAGGTGVGSAISGGALVIATLTST
tara:strand:- start:1033 stop:1407 length:375 start_codon:yes stop_codon:yes gene_type:complete